MVTVRLEFTPNPNTLKFVIDGEFLPQGAVNFTQSSQALMSPLGQRLFRVPGVQAVMVGKNFITITKAADGNWDILADEVPIAIQAHVESKEKAFDEKWLEDYMAVGKSSGSDIEKRIKEVLDTEIRPAVAMDGGDIVFSRYDNGIVYLNLQGACSSCPSSIATLKMGVESRLKEVIPEIKEVVQV